MSILVFFLCYILLSNGTTFSPSMTTSSPSMTTFSPSVTTSSPSMTTNIPTITTSSPSMTTFSPSMTTSSPTLTTFSPSMTTSSPSMTTFSPSVTTFGPSMTTIDPTSAPTSVPTSNPTIATFTPLYEYIRESNGNDGYEAITYCYTTTSHIQGTPDQSIIFRQKVYHFAKILCFLPNNFPITESNSVLPSPPNHLSPMLIYYYDLLTGNSHNHVKLSHPSNFGPPSSYQAVFTDPILNIWYEGNIGFCYKDINQYPNLVPIYIHDHGYLTFQQPLVYPPAPVCYVLQIDGTLTPTSTPTNNPTLEVTNAPTVNPTKSPLSTNIHTCIKYPICSTSGQITLTDQITIRDSIYIQVPGTVTPYFSELKLYIHGSHTYQGDLQMRLYSPNGTEILLVSNKGGDQYDFQIVFSDDGIPILENDNIFYQDCYEREPAGSSFKVEFDGESVNGLWEVEIIDSYAGDTGIWEDWCFNELCWYYADQF